MWAGSRAIAYLRITSTLPARSLEAVLPLSRSNAEDRGVIGGGYFAEGLPLLDLVILRFRGGSECCPYWSESCRWMWSGSCISKPLLRRPPDRACESPGCDPLRSRIPVYDSISSAFRPVRRNRRRWNRGCLLSSLCKACGVFGVNDPVGIGMARSHRNDQFSPYGQVIEGKLLVSVIDAELA